MNFVEYQPNKSAIILKKIDKSYISIILGLKVNHIRNEMGISTDDFAKMADISKSYLNEIEKGKKYPKGDKMMKLARALNLSYDELVSLELPRKLQPVGKLMESGILSEIPLNLFGIDEKSVIEIIVNAPDKITAFISTLLEMANNYNFSRESFYLAALRSYQEVHDNYFPELETKSRTFSEEFNVQYPLTQADLEQILQTHFGYTIYYIPFENEKPELSALRSLFVPESKTLLINTTTLPQQILFILAKEIGFVYLNLKDRVNTFTWAEFETFEQVLYNFYASYFAGALLIPEDDLAPKLKKFFSEKKWNADVFNRIMGRYHQSPETFYHRLTNLVPQHLGLQSLFFIRLVHEKHSERYRLDKELHLDEKQSPHAIEMDEHYCRRWVSVKVLQKLEKSGDELFTDCQYSVYPQYGHKRYWVISTATQDPFRAKNLRSVTIGFASAGLVNKIKFDNGDAIPEFEVDITCENCPIQDCQVRMSPPVRLQQKEKWERIVVSVDELSEKYITEKN